MPLIGFNETVLIGAALVALVLGPKKLPELARAIGLSKQEYRKGVAADDTADDAGDTDNA